MNRFYPLLILLFSTFILLPVTTNAATEKGVCLLFAVEHALDVSGLDVAGFDKIVAGGANGVFFSRGPSVQLNIV